MKKIAIFLTGVVSSFIIPVVASTDVLVSIGTLSSTDPDEFCFAEKSISVAETAVICRDEV